MESNIVEMDLDFVLNELKKQRDIFLAEPLKISEKILSKIDELIDKTELIKLESRLNNKVLIGSLVDLEICYADGEIENESYYLGLDLGENTISVFSPLGFAIYGANIHETVSYSVKGNYIEATVLNKNVMVEKFPAEELLLSNTVFDTPTKSKVRN